MISKADRERLESQLAHGKSGYVVPVWLSDEDDHETDMISLKDQSRWRCYAEHELYTLFHYKQRDPTGGRVERLWWADYHRMNKLFADRIMKLYKPGDIIVIHDYQLLLLPAILRQRISEAYIGYFLHIPFPSSEYLRCLSRRKEILQGMLGEFGAEKTSQDVINRKVLTFRDSGANLVGFQSYGYSRHFVSCCKRILRFESSPAGIDAYGAHVAIDIFPIGIHASATRQMAYDDPAVETKMRSLRELYGDKKIIVGRDRLDAVRGVAQKLQAFELFLEWYPEWRDKVVLIQVTSPTSVEEEREDSAHKIANKVSDLVSRINGTYGSLSFSPVQHHSQYISREEYFALLRIADVGLITSVRDGMNTTSLEFVVCQEGNCGPLILSEFSGTAGSLSSAMHINPWDLGGVAKCIDAALNMPYPERKDQHNKLHNHVTTNTIQAWTNKFLSRLMTTISSFGQAAATPSLDKALLLSTFRTSQKRLFMFDYDGTLTPIVKDPQSAIPSDRVIRTLKTLASDPRNAVWIISGRDQAFLDEWMGHIPELGLSAEHGSFLRHPMSQTWENITEKTDMSWQSTVMRVFQHFTEKTQGSFIERKRVALTWHYRAADPEYGAYQAEECRKYLEETVTPEFEVEVMAGKANLEVRPRFVNKGEIAKRLIADHSADVSSEVETLPAPDPPPQTIVKEHIHVASGPDFVLCSGDDFTDEDMFRALAASDLPKERVFSVTVGASSKVTEASWHLLEPGDVVGVLGMLNGVVDGGSVGDVAVLDGVESVNGSRL